MSPTVVGIDAGHRECAALERLLDRALVVCGPAELVCTHVVEGHWAGSLLLRGPGPVPIRLAAELSCAVTVLSADGSRTSAGDPAWQASAARAADELSGRTAGRAVRFVGQELLVGEIDTQAVTELSAITAVHAIAGIPTAGTRLVTRDFLRPVLEDGELVLTVRLFADDGRLVPFEVPDPVACCAVHA